MYYEFYVIKKINYLFEFNLEYSIYVCECIFFMYIIFGVNLVYIKLLVCIFLVFYYIFYIYFFIYIFV